MVAGLGVAVGILAAGIFPNQFFAAAVGAIAGVAIALGLLWLGRRRSAGVIGGLAGGFGAAPVVAGSAGAAARRRSSGPGRHPFALIALGAAALAFVPGVGYFNAIVMPAARGARSVRRQTPERYAGLRTLARDWMSSAKDG